MKKILLAVAFLVFVVGAAALRSFLEPAPIPLPKSARGVVLIAVEGLEPRAANTAFASVPFSGYGLIPTRNGTANERDVNAAMRMILTGSRSSPSDAPSLPDVVRAQGGSLTIHVITGPHALPDATALVNRYTGANGLPEGISLLVFGVTPSSNALARRERVAPIYFWTRSQSANIPHLLTSPSTRHRPGLVAATDIATTASTLLNLPTNQRTIGDGRAIAFVVPRTTERQPPASLLEQNTALWGRQAREQQLLPFLPWLLAVLFGISRFAPSFFLRRVLRVTALATPFCVIVTAPLVPEAISASWVVYAFAAIPILCLAILAGGNPKWATQLPRTLAIVTMLVLVVDTGTGGYLLSRTPLSYSVLEAARFYGIGNEVSGLFLGASLVAVGTDQGVLATLLWGLAIAVLSGAPALGADAGGFVAALIAFSVLALSGSKLSRSWHETSKRVVLGTVAILAVVVGFALWDGTRPETSRTHIGEAVATVRKRGWAPLYRIATRKVSVNARLLVTSPWAVLFYGEVGYLILQAYKRKKTSPSGHPTNTVDVSGALATALIALFALNDSGVVAGATSGLWFCAAPSEDRDEGNRADMPDDTIVL